MKKTFLFSLAALSLAAHAEVVTLDLTQPEGAAELAYAENRVWAGTFSDVASLKFQDFEFVHYGTEAPYPTWEGFTVSKSTNKTYSGDYMNEQWNNVAGGGLKGEGTPYVVFYATSGFYSLTANDIYFATPATPKEIAFCQSAWTEYCILGKDSYARGFAKGDSCTITIQALDENHEAIEGLSIIYYLADYTAEDPTQWKQNAGWEKCDLTSLGEIHGLRFTFSSTDTGEWGINTAQYFTLDGLVIEKEDTALESIVRPTEDTKKIMENGQVYIIRNQKKYTVMGVEVR